MGFDHRFRLSVHAVITDEKRRVLLLRATYGNLDWGLPGGALEPGETIHEALQRECMEELGSEVVIGSLTGVYLHTAVESHVFIFRCELLDGAPIVLSPEHSEFRYFAAEELGPVQRQRVLDCLSYSGSVHSASF